MESSFNAIQGGARILARTTRSRVTSLGHALCGIVFLVRTEFHGRIHLSATLLVAITGFLLDLGPVAWALLVVACALVWITEALNTAIERLCDVVSPRFCLARLSLSAGSRDRP